MEAEGFDVYEFESWHFDYRDWSGYPISNLTFQQIKYGLAKTPTTVSHEVWRVGMRTQPTSLPRRVGLHAT